METKRIHRIQIALDDAEKCWVDSETDANGFENPQQYARYAMKRFPELNGTLMRLKSVVESESELKNRVSQLTKERDAALTQLRDVEARLRKTIEEREGYKSNVAIVEHNLKQSVDVQSQLKRFSENVDHQFKLLKEHLIPKKRKWFGRK